MKKEFVAVYKPNPFSAHTKFHFKNTRLAEDYIKNKQTESVELSHRADWIIVNSKGVGRVLTILEEENKLFSNDEDEILT